MAVGFASLGITITIIAAECCLTSPHTNACGHEKGDATYCWNGPNNQGFQTCGGATNQNACTNANAYEVNSGLSGGCTEDNNSYNSLYNTYCFTEHNNCANVSDNCYRSVSCTWDLDCYPVTCRKIEGSESSWYVVRSKSTATCN